MGLTTAASSIFSTPSSPDLWANRRQAGRRRTRVRVTAASDDSPSEEPARRTKRKHVDTRIHWANQEDGWIGGTKTAKPQADGSDAEQQQSMGKRFADLINQSSASHYQFLGVTAKAEAEEIKAAYRRLSKDYHPDTTSLPLKAASEKFMKLREAYNVLSKEESRRFYDWTLVQEAESRRLAAMLEDPYQQDLRNEEPIPDAVDRLAGRNMKLSDQAMTALTIDVAIIIFCIFSIIYAVFFKEQY
uniref:Chaperone DnaJ-domain superfamily protein n=1 Tax=Apostasia odorata TaxID=280455 RepID=A0A0F7CZA2_9ASPA|nr:hypothetical protein [Apostasia odorata]